MVIGNRKRLRATREKSNIITTHHQTENAPNSKAHDSPMPAPRVPYQALAGSNHVSASDLGVRYSEDLDPTLSHESLRRSSKIPRIGRRISPASAESSTAVKLENSYTSSQKIHDRKIRTLNNEPQTLDVDRNVSTRSFERFSPLLSRDFRATAEDLERLMKGPSPARDFRATAADLERLMKSNGSSGYTGDYFGQPMLRSRSGSEMRDHPHSQPEQGYKRVAAGRVTVRNSASMSQNTLLPAFNTSALRILGSKGTPNDPIEIGSDSDLGDEDEDEDVDMLYDCEATPAVIDPQVLPRDCAVCSDSVFIAEMPSLKECAHQPATCSVCFARWIESELTTKGWKRIVCPDVSCNVTLTHYEVQTYATPDVFAQYDKYSMRDVLGQLANFRWCRNPSCTSGQEHDDDSYIFTCVACGHKACIAHDADWHEGETCDEYTYRVSGAKEREQKAQEEASIAVICQSSKKCPGPDCAFSIQKNEGCDHMTCKCCDTMYREGDFDMNFLRFTMSTRVLLGVLGRLSKDPNRRELLP
jgi:hypothetical protein